jgi:hypothetical protein
MEVLIQCRQFEKWPQKKLLEIEEACKLVMTNEQHVVMNFLDKDIHHHPRV